MEEQDEILSNLDRFEEVECSMEDHDDGTHHDSGPAKFYVGLTCPSCGGTEVNAVCEKFAFSIIHSKACVTHSRCKFEFIIDGNARILERV